MYSFYYILFLSPYLFGNLPEMLCFVLSLLIVYIVYGLYKSSSRCAIARVSATSRTLIKIGRGVFFLRAGFCTKSFYVFFIERGGCRLLHPVSSPPNHFLSVMTLVKIWRREPRKYEWSVPLPRVSLWSIWFIYLFFNIKLRYSNTVSTRALAHPLN